MCVYLCVFTCTHFHVHMNSKYIDTNMYMKLKYFVCILCTYKDIYILCILYMYIVQYEGSKQL